MAFLGSIILLIKRRAQKLCRTSHRKLFAYLARLVVFVCGRSVTECHLLFLLCFFLFFFIQVSNFCFSSTVFLILAFLPAASVFFVCCFAARQTTGLAIWLPAMVELIEVNYIMRLRVRFVVKAIGKADWSVIS